MRILTSECNHNPVFTNVAFIIIAILTNKTAYLPDSFASTRPWIDDHARWRSFLSKYYDEWMN